MTQLLCRQLLRPLFRLRCRFRVRVAIGFYVRFRVRVKERYSVKSSAEGTRLVCGIDGGAIVAGANVMESFQRHGLSDIPEWTSGMSGRLA